MARRRPHAFLRRFAQARTGVAAVEFAVLLPMLMILYLGASEISIAMTLNRKLQSVSSVTADLVAQLSSTSPGEITSILAVTRALVEPYRSTDVKIVMSSVTIDSRGVAKVDWSEATSGAAERRKGSPFTLPASFAQQVSRSFVVAEAAYAFRPMGGYGIAGTLNMRQASYLTPRNVPAVACPDC